MYRCRGDGDGWGVELEDGGGERDVEGGGWEY